MRLSPRFFLLLALPFAVAAAKQVDPFLKVGKDGQITYRTNDRGDRVPDFSHAGYRGGGVPLPEVPARVLVTPVAGDNGARIQAAIDYVATLAPDATGLRGAVQLAAGRYEI